MSDDLGYYGLFALLGLLASIVLSRLVRGQEDQLDGGARVLLLLGALAGATLGAKLAYLLAEGWAAPNTVALLTGRSITGGLLGGYGGVELVKKALGITRTTGDAFAVMIPSGLIFGRLGCSLSGCCLGVPLSGEIWHALGVEEGTRWPATTVELLFNAGFLLWALVARRKGWFPENRFHVYLIAYGAFRFLHEMLRDTVKIGSVFSGYQLVALALLMFGVWRFWQRRTGAAANTCDAVPRA